MKTRFWILLAMLTLSIGLWASPIHSAHAQEDPAISEAEREEEQNNIQGAGMLILGVGLVVILMVGGAYAPRRTEPTHQ